MLQTKLKEIAKIFNSQALLGSDVVINGVFTDTRKKMQGGLFVALMGENFDAHDYIDHAEKMGAVAIIASKQVKTNLPVICGRHRNCAQHNCHVAFEQHQTNGCGDYWQQR